MIQHVATLDVETMSDDNLTLLLAGMEDVLRRNIHSSELLTEMVQDTDRIRAELARREQGVQHA